MINYELNSEEMKQMSLARDLKAANYKIVDKEAGKIQVEYAYTYSGTLEFYFETGMEGLASTLHDYRGWHEEPSWNNETKKNDGPLEKYKSLEWSTFIRGGEYLTIFDGEVGEGDAILWEGLLLRDTEAPKDKGYRHHFLPQRIPYKDWVKWCKQEYRAEIQTNVPVLAEKKHSAILTEDKTILTEDKTILNGDKNMDNFKESQMFLDSTKRLLADTASLGLSVLSSSSLNKATAYELVVSNEEGTVAKLERLHSCGVLAYDGYVLNEETDTYTIIYCQKTQERVLKDSLMNHLDGLGFAIIGMGDTDPNKGFICSVVIDDVLVLQKLENHKTLIFDGYTAVGTEGNYELVYIFPEEN